MVSEEIPSYDYILLISTFLLISLGFIFIYSASSNIALYKFSNPYFFLKKQAISLFIGIFFMLISMHIPYRIYSNPKFIYGLLLLSLTFLLLLFFIGHKISGAVRWIRIKGFSFQPTELAKLSLCLYIAHFMTKNSEKMKTFKIGILPNLLLVGLFILLIMKQPDKGTALMITVWLFIMLFVGGCKLAHLFMTSVSFFLLFIFYLSHSEYVIHRWKAFLDPWKYYNSYGFQIIHSFYAFGTGGLTGVGLGSGKQKLFYLPEPYTDFILPVIGEELGFLGVFFVIFLYFVIVTRGISIAVSSNNLFNRYLAFAITSMFCLQVIINMGVSMNLLPAKGLTLPLLSYGGSSLLITMTEIGILLNVSAKR